MSTLHFLSLVLAATSAGSQQPGVYTCQAERDERTIGSVQANSQREAVEKYQAAHPQYAGVWCTDAAGRAILERAARSNAEAQRGIEIPESSKNQCVVNVDERAKRFITGGKLDLESWLAVASDQQKLAAISCITAQRQRLADAERTEFQRCTPVLRRIAAGMSNERAMATAMQAQCERYLLPAQGTLRSPRADGATTRSTTPAASLDRIYREQEVTESVVLATPSIGPAYPRHLRTAGVEGRVLMEFVVDTSGVVEPSSVRVLKSDHADFTRAVHMLLPNLRFTAARIGTQRVRQRVEQPFEFSLNRD